LRFLYFTLEQIIPFGYNGIYAFVQKKRGVIYLFQVKVSYS